MGEFMIREMKDGESDCLKEFIYQAIFQREGELPLSRSVIQNPDIAVYIEDFGKPDDLCLVAENQGEIVGAVWTRILNGPVKGFGNIDAKTPEFAISVLPAFRGKGIGTKMMEAMLSLLAQKGYERASLAVQKDNYAVSMYQKVGFQIIETTKQEYIMVVQLPHPSI